jgi:hypothetical protein
MFPLGCGLWFWCIPCFYPFLFSQPGDGVQTFYLDRNWQPSKLVSGFVMPWCMSVRIWREQMAIVNQVSSSNITSPFAHHRFINNPAPE